MTGASRSAATRPGPARRSPDSGPRHDDTQRNDRPPAARPARPTPNPHRTSFRNHIVLFLVLATAGALPVLVFHLDAAGFDVEISEQSLTEWTQLLTLMLTIGCFAVVAVRNPTQRPFAILACGLFGAMLIRELDHAFKPLGSGSWQIVVMLIVLGSGILARRQPASWKAGLFRFLDSRAGTLMMVALVTLLVYSRLFGMEALWAAALGEHYTRAVKNGVEEVTELYAYLLVLVAAVLHAWRHAFAERDRQGTVRLEVVRTTDCRRTPPEARRHVDPGPAAAGPGVDTPDAEMPGVATPDRHAEWISPPGGAETPECPAARRPSGPSR